MAQSQVRLYHQYSRHVSGPLSPDKLEFYRLNQKYIEKRFPTIKPEWLIDVTSGVCRGLSIFPWIDNYIISHEPTMDITYMDIWKLIWETTIESLTIQASGLTKDLQRANVNQFMTILQDMKESAELTYAGKSKIFIVNLHDKLEEEAEKGQPTFSIPSLPNIDFIGDLVVLKDFPGGPIVITYQMFVNCLDKIEAKFSWFYYIEYMDKHPSRANFETKQLFMDLYTILEESYAKLGNEAIRIYKNLEALMVGISLQALDPITHDHNFGYIIRDSFKEDRPQLHPYMIKIWTIGKSYLHKHGPVGCFASIYK